MSEIAEERHGVAAQRPSGPTCTATISPRPGVVLRCDRKAGHITNIPDTSPSDRYWHYDFHQDADWTVNSGHLIVDYRTVGDDR